MPEVMEFYRMAGDVDYMLRVAVADMSAYDAFYKRMIEAWPLKNVLLPLLDGTHQGNHRLSDFGRCEVASPAGAPAGARA